MNIDDQKIEIFDNVKLPVKYLIDQCHYPGQNYTYGSKFYFVMRSKEVSSRNYLFCFDPNKKVSEGEVGSIECIWEKGREFHFVQNRIIVVGSGANDDGSTITLCLQYWI